MRAPTGPTARLVAFDVLSAVRDSDAYANLLLPVRIERARLSPADAGLATELTYGTLRLRGYYDAVIRQAAGRELDQIDPPVADLLRLGAHQLLSMRVPSHAAVNETVRLAAQTLGRSKTGFVNAVLRNIARTAPEKWRARVAAAADGDDRIAALTSHPAWIVRAFRQALTAERRRGGDVEAELQQLLDADNAAPRVNLVALPGVGEVPEEAEPDRFSPYGFTLPGDPFPRVRASRGTLRVQDEGSQLAALALVAARPVEAGEQWLDLCAGPGGKAALLGAEALRGGARLLANEVVPARVGLVRNAVAPVADAVEVVEGDGRAFGDTHRGRFDRILLDAPCTGLGALRRRPEARWRKHPRDVAELTRLQAALLDSAIRALKPGGVLAYVTCSPHLGETRVAIADALKHHPGELDELPTQEIVQSTAAAPLELAGDPAQAQLWPHRHGTDAMFIALLQKR
ncbi:RsmB/NOP family class I SAM-dependent RNA methyltransferase [Gryllotalpicola ginsengisoli]|uniref:RsmB/NOP family class I SAM-dependent RNA methyltransferase n=1 Tax=Gryllotalpicola ginsengisoli TaxID=444608 RepID=UPI0003B61AF6|nr:transcription antitermination factor NusB [Gryllotalpicola ginsengisoli]